MKRQVVLSNWRDDLSEYVNLNNVTPQKAKTDTRAGEKIEEKDVKNKVVINPTMSEAFEELGGIIISVTEELSKEEMEEMENNKDTKEGRRPGKVEESSIQMKIHQLMKRVQALRLAGERQNIGDEKKQEKREKQEKKQQKEQQKEKQKSQKGKEDQEQDVQMQQVNDEFDMDKADMGDVVKDFYKSNAPQFKGKSKKKRRQMAIAAKLEADGKPLKSESAALRFMQNKYKDSLITPSSKPKKPSKEELDDRAAKRAANRKSGPMAQDPYKPRAGESD